ncbi:MAG: YibE/F family protein [Kiritimatiellae bacterium]|nr:YibE/F family protein [Kiritimatiellia bacterium]
MRKVGGFLARLSPAVAIVLLLAAPGPRFERPPGAQKPDVAEVAETDDSGLHHAGPVEFGTQQLTLRMPDGRMEPACNELRAQPEFDKKFRPGDKAVVVSPPGREEGEPYIARDHWRMGRYAAAAALFAAALCAVAGKSGATALLTFAAGCLAIWKILVPAVLAGWDARAASFLVASALAAVVSFSVATSAKTGFCAFAGSMLGIAASAALSSAFAEFLRVNGATMPFSQQLLNAGIAGIDLQDVFCGAATIAASGAVTDLGMDISAGVAEVSRHNPSLGFRELFASGRRIGAAVLGTMATTLLLAYSGGYLTMLASFAAAGAAPADFLNTPLVAAEAAKTLAGSFGLVLTAPFTAAAAAWIFKADGRER